MPRRPRKQPSVSRGGVTNKKAPRPLKRSDSKISKWVTRDDIVGDEEDDFHSKRDQILLTGGANEGDEDWGAGDEEVFGLDLDDSSDQGDDEEHDDEQEDEDDDELGAEEPKKESKSRKESKKFKKKDSSPPPSEGGSDSEEIESWGKKKSAYYSSNADILALKEGEEDEDEAYEMEEQEAKRLQAKMRDGMDDGDFGLDDVAEIIEDDIEEKDVTSSNAIPSDTPLDKESAIRRLEKTSPETLALAREWDDVAHDLLEVQERINKQSGESESMAMGLSHLHHQTLLTYVATLAFYLHLRSTPPPLSPQTQSRLKVVLDRLLILKQALSTMEDLDFDASSEEEDDSEDSDISDMDDGEKAEMMRLFASGGDGFSGSKKTDHLSKKDGLSQLDALLAEADAEIAARVSKPKNKKQAKKTSSAPDKKSKKTKDSSQNAFDLVEPEFVPAKGSGRRTRDDSAESYGETTSLSVADDADKKERKRGLRFYTNKIETTARKREEGREKFGGDDDIPYREREREKQARIRREIAKARGTGGDDLGVDNDGAETETASVASAKRKRGPEGSGSGDEDENGYYELVKRAKKDRKEEKKRVYDEARQAEKMELNVEESAQGPRSLTRAILKNKGLTPHRSKSVRNPRVKKREKYEKAKKKVRSQKAVYKGGLAGKPYGGEESGITKVVKSVKLV
ncbi:hypothetical protein M422DRAFT_239973 [Sphaerobolus stellatus SS14]|nr:hypothetical protein M422DRAFT_239973 [Sphaerobolus stellatus SS14]